MEYITGKLVKGSEVKSGDLYWNSVNSVWLSARTVIGNEAYKDSVFLVRIPLPEHLSFENVMKFINEKINSNPSEKEDNKK